MVRKFQPKVPIKETEVAASVISWLEENNWDVYQEVDNIDIVAVRGSIIWAIECKTKMGFDVLDQALARRPYVNGVLVATPPKDKARIVRLACAASGIGWLVVTRSKINMECYPEFQRRTIPGLRERLRPEHKTYAKAGSPTGRGWTPFKETCRNLVHAVKRNPGIPMKKTIKLMKHHYKNDSSATRSLSEYILKGIIKEIRLEEKNGELLLYLNSIV